MDEKCCFKADDSLNLAYFGAIGFALLVTWCVLFKSYRSRRLSRHCHDNSA